MDFLNGMKGVVRLNLRLGLDPVILEAMRVLSVGKLDTMQMVGKALYSSGMKLMAWV